MNTFKTIESKQKFVLSTKYYNDSILYGISWIFYVLLHIMCILYILHKYIKKKNVEEFYG